MIYTCKQCSDFSAYSEKVLNQHLVEKHHASTTKPTTQRESFNFLLPLKGKQIAIKLIDGDTLTGILKRFNDYELLVEIKGSDHVVLKHAIVRLWEVATA